MEEIGLFPLDVVLVPGERLPLHIFEERYRELIGECLDRSIDFGIIYQQGVALSPVGTRASVSQVLARHEDGRLDILVTGGRRFRLVEQTSGRSFLTSLVDEVEDLDDPPSTEELAACLGALGRVLTVLGDDGPDLAGDPDHAAFAIAGHLALPAELKQELLAMLSERDRILRLTKALTGSVVTDLQAGEIARRATGNGKVDHL